MGVDVYLEDQIHGRTYAGPNAGLQLARMLANAKSDGLLSGVNLHCDTMFNIVQLRQFESELDAMSETNPDLRYDVDSLKQIFEKVTRNRGYLWLAGD